jgi:hypothetical protein
VPRNPRSSSVGLTHTVSLAVGGNCKAAASRRTPKFALFWFVWEIGGARLRGWVEG